MKAARLEDKAPSPVADRTVQRHASRFGQRSEFGAIVDELEARRYLGRAMTTDLDR